MQGKSSDVGLNQIRETVASDEISIPTLLKLSYRLIKIAAFSLIILQLTAQYVGLLLGKLLEHVTDMRATFPGLFILGIFGILLSSVILLLPILALLRVYEIGSFGLQSIIQKTCRKLLKLWWTILLPSVAIVAALLAATAIIYIIPSSHSIVRGAAILVIAFAFLTFWIWLSVPLYFITYLVFCTKHYGLSAIRIAIKMIENQWWKLFCYIVFITLIILAFTVPAYILMEKGYLIAYFAYIPVSIVTLFGEAYNLLLYKHVVSKIGESNIDLVLQTRRKKKRFAKMCKHCGEKLAMDIRVCTYCGKELSDEDVMIL